MESALQDIKFKYSFRDYQAEALSNLQNYLSDRKLHIVAAPGAGKTILALELMLRLGRKALILAPSLAIKEQWIERLTKDFENGDKPNLISSELENPSIVTVDTYQALYALNRKDTDIANIIKENNIQTIIFDEAHHLRRSWQKVLKQTTEKLKDCVTISITATPPYDGDNEYTNYMDLCGPIDAKITIPQLVRSDCLCPHQDYIFFNTLNSEHEKAFREHNVAVEEFAESMKKNTSLLKIVALHDYILNPSENASDILNDFNFFVAMLSYLKCAGYSIPEHEGFAKLNIPDLDYALLGTLLERIVFDKKTKEQDILKDDILEIKQQLRDLGCIDEDNRISLKYSKRISDLLTRNYEKLGSISQIIEIEKESRGDDLKLVIATDYIKDEYYDTEDEDDIKELGVVPIYRKIIACNPDTKAAVLTGTLTIIPTDLADKLRELAEDEFGIKRDEIRISELGINFDYSKVEFEPRHAKYKVNLITKLFEQSDISVLIGTIALIGEGWDAPFVNSMIMATYISSYVTSNQLRGRAIRKYKLDENKFANIWHLVCMENDGDSYVLGYDYDILSKRFRAFEGIDIEHKKIASGIKRLNVADRKYQKEELAELNNRMIAYAENRKFNSDVWKIALATYVPLTTEKLEIKDSSQNPALLNELIDSSESKHSLFGKIYDLLYNRNISYDKYLRVVCAAVHGTLVESRTISADTSWFMNQDGATVEYGLNHASTFEQILFIDTVKEALDMQSNSRYIAEFNHRACTVPARFAKNKDDASKFLAKVKAHKKRLVYTRSDKGKRVLLRHKLEMMQLEQ